MHTNRLHLLAASLIALSAIAQAAPDSYGPRNTIPREALMRVDSRSECPTTLRLSAHGPRPHYEIVRGDVCTLQPPMRTSFIGPRATIPAIN
jgi:hypothetical protein